MNLKTLDGLKTSIVYGMPYIAESVIRRLKPQQVVFTFDGGRSPFRTGLLSTYKDRDKKLGFDYEDFMRQKDLGRDLFRAFGIAVAYHKGYEADDIIAMITRRAQKANWDVVIVSGDKDFNQLISKPEEGSGEVSIYNTTKNSIVDYKNLKSITGYEPHETVDYLCLLGDDSDKIPGYPGIGPKKALQILEEFGSVEHLLRSGGKFGKVDMPKLKEVWERNKKLIDLRYFYRKFLIKEPVPWMDEFPEYNEKNIKRICSSCEINSFLHPQFLNTFKKLSDNEDIHNRS